MAAQATVRFKNDGLRYSCSTVSNYQGPDDLQAAADP